MRQRTRTPVRATQTRTGRWSSVNRRPPKGGTATESASGALLTLPSCQNPKSTFRRWRARMRSRKPSTLRRTARGKSFLRRTSRKTAAASSSWPRANSVRAYSSWTRLSPRTTTGEVLQELRGLREVPARDQGLRGGKADGGRIGIRGAACMVRRRSSQAATRDLRRGRRRAPERRPAAGRPFVLSRVTAPRPRRCRKSGRRRWLRPSAPCTSSMVTGRRDARMLLRSEAATRGNTVEAAVEVSRYSSPCRRPAVVFRRRRPRPARPCGPGRMRGMDSVRGCTDKHRRPAAAQSAGETRRLA